MAKHVMSQPLKLISHVRQMDKTSKLFDVWANTGRSEDMEKGHGTTVNQFLDNLWLNKNFRLHHN